MASIPNSRFLEKVRAEIVNPQLNVTTSSSEFKSLVRQEVERIQSINEFREAAGRPRVLLEAYSDLQFLVRLFALWEIGAVVVPIDPNVTEAERGRLIESAQPEFQYISSEKGLERLRRPGTQMLQGSLPEDACLLMLTSGTTGLPKVVIHGASNLEARFQNGRSAIPKTDRLSCLSLLPLHFGHGLIGVVLQALFDSQRLVLVPPRLGDPMLTSQIGPWIDRHEVSFVSGTPATWTFLVRMSPPPAGSSLRRVQMASAHATRDLQMKVRKWAQAPLFNCYGTTETASWISDRLIEEGVEAHNVGSGKNWNSIFQIVDPDQEGVGKVTVITQSNSYGYLSDWYPGKLKQAEYETGDIGKLNPDGELLIFGRESRTINRGGLKVSPEEVESEILSLGLVQDAAVFGLSTLNGETKDIDSIVGILVLKEEAEMSAESLELALYKGLSLRISSHKIPGQWLIWDSIPRLSNGKLNVRSIKEKFNRRT